MNHSFVVGTYNARVCVPGHSDENRWEDRAARYRETVRRNGLEIFGMQEPLLWQVQDVVAGTPFAYIGGGREDFKEKGEFSCIVYNTERFEMKQQGTFGLSETPEIPGARSWNSCCPRIASWGFFFDKVTGKEFIYYNTHLDHVSELARVKGIEMVVAHAGAKAAGKPLILTGDFNAYPESETYRKAAELLRDSAEISETPHTGGGMTFHNWGACEPPDAPIDYIFVSREFKVLRHWTDTKKAGTLYGSDHFPVAAEVEIC